MFFLLTLDLFGGAAGATPTKPKGISIDFQPDVPKTRGFQPSTKRVWIHGDQSVTDMYEAHREALQAQAVNAHEEGARSQHTPNFPKKLVLQFRGMHVMKHV